MIANIKWMNSMNRTIIHFQKRNINAEKKNQQMDEFHEQNNYSLPKKKYKC